MATAAATLRRTFSRRFRVALVVWMGMLGLDFVLNGAVFARLYQEEGAFILPPTEAFRRIPLGYLAFLILAIAIVELEHRLHIVRLVDGARVGLVVGGVFAVTWSLGLFSIATLSAQAALAFAVIWFALVVLASGVGAMGLGRASLRRLAVGICAFDVLCIVVVIGLQTFGVVPTMTRLGA